MTKQDTINMYEQLQGHYQQEYQPLPNLQELLLEGDEKKIEEAIQSIPAILAANEAATLVNELLQEHNPTIHQLRGELDRMRQYINANQVRIEMSEKLEVKIANPKMYREKLENQKRLGRLQSQIKHYDNEITKLQGNK